MPRDNSKGKPTATRKRTITQEILPEKEDTEKREDTQGRDQKGRLSISSENLVMCRVGNFDEHYLVIGKIGEGSFGSVYRVRHRQLRLQRALKTIKKRGPQHFSSFEEIEVLKRLDHANILKIYEFYEAADSYYIITEIFEGKELYNLLLDQEKLTERHAADILREVLRAVNYTHAQKIAHRDIKPQNILIRMNGSRFKVKIIDWGLGTLMGKGKANRVCGTPQYVAPEVLRGSYSLSCDMWSIGAIAFVMLTGDMPFLGQNEQQTLDAVMKGVVNTRLPAFKALSPQARNFIGGLLNRNPQRRLTASEALHHEWMRANASEQVEPVLLVETLERLRQYQYTNGLATAVISYVNNHLSQEEQREKLQAIFKHLDTNSDGVLSLEELVTGYSKIYGREMGKQIALETFGKLDINHNNSLEFSEFVTFGLKQQREQKENKLRAAFDLFDRDKNGKISKEEISFVLRGKVDPSLEPEIIQIIADIDQNGDQEIDADQFIGFIERATTADGKKQEGEAKQEVKQEEEKKEQTQKVGDKGKDVNSDSRLRETRGNKKINNAKQTPGKKEIGKKQRKESAIKQSSTSKGVHTRILRSNSKNL